MTIPLCGQRLDSLRILRGGAYPWLSRWTLIPMRSVLVRLGQKEIWKIEGKWCKEGGRGKDDTAISSDWWQTEDTCKSQETAPSQGPLKRSRLCWQLDFSQMRPISDPWPQELEENKFVLSHACDSTIGKLRHQPTRKLQIQKDDLSRPDELQMPTRVAINYLWDSLSFLNCRKRLIRFSSQCRCEDHIR